MTEQDAPLLRIENLEIGFGNGAGRHTAVHDVSLTVNPAEIVGLVGESGSGKSLTCRSVLRLIPVGGRITSGDVRLGGQELLDLSAKEMREVRAHQVGMVFQDPFTSLNPTLRIGTQVIETLRANGGLSREAARRRAVELLTQVEIPLPEERLRAYPHELSGGMRQRVMIALAMAADPQLLIADEPTTALDVSTQAQVLALLRRIRDERGMSILLVSHDFGVVAAICDRVVVMYGGFVVESGSIEQVYGAPAHPYTRALLNAVPDLTLPPPGYRRPAIPGPPLGSVPYEAGCPFAPRCRFARDACGSVPMSLEPVAGDHLTACPFADDAGAGVAAVVQEVS
ncbi:ABC transporter ATP-binding protein [Nocardioides marmoriginsengisoli]|uniref:ABC transporter ATP-binding protein n=1 Tax=Nocardioides marmoriginsengisoli TaxID=661483 RepID=A0A3N0CGE1_9ACTN|nr:ABC transporter ATP-binding protein [Nocardioides marmoriginsengisoli]RNL62530.1 ABC transporter ATP-binding protein [Nocardioides marmoriginsengisoli]